MGHSTSNNILYSAGSKYLERLMKLAVDLELITNNWLNYIAPKRISIPMQNQNSHVLSEVNEFISLFIVVEQNRECPITWSRDFECNNLKFNW